jgi:hypothetical protein
MISGLVRIKAAPVNLPRRHLRLDVWSGRAVQEVSSALADADWSALCSEPSWISARLRSRPAGAQARRARFDLAARPLLPQHDRAALILADDVERVRCGGWTP